MSVAYCDILLFLRRLKFNYSLYHGSRVDLTHAFNDMFIQTIRYERVHHCLDIRNCNAHAINNNPNNPRCVTSNIKLC